MTTDSAPTDRDWRQFDELELPPILRGALEAFAEHGFHGTSVREIATRAGVTVPLLYYHYGSKEGIFLALIDLAIQDLAWRTEAAAEAGATPTEQLANIAEVVVLRVTNQHRFAGLSGEARHLSSENRARYTEPRDRIEEVVDRVLADGVETGEFADLDPVETARALLGMWQSVWRWYSPKGPATPQQIADRYVELSLRMVRSEGQAGR
jgi:AcrR family transcriptional regulator